jgi:hypothetical protein
MKTMIPKIFHQIWMGWDLPEPPPAAEEYKQTWVEHHPDWEFRLWNALECRNLGPNVGFGKQCTKLCLKYRPPSMAILQLTYWNPPVR